MQWPTARHVPLVRRLLFAHPVRTAASAVAVGVALTLMLLLNGLWAGVRGQVTTFEDHSGAQLVVVSPGTDTLFADPSILPASTTARVAAVAGVDWAVPARTGYQILDLHNRRVAVALVGAVAGRPGSPWNVASGRAPRTDLEAAVDQTLADRHGLRIGDRLPVMGSPIRIVGITRDSAMFMTPLVFITERAAAILARLPQTTGIVLVGTDSPDQVAARLRATGLTVRTTRQLHDAALRLATRIFGAPIRLMVTVAFIAGALIVALVAHLLISEQRRHLGVLKALGAPPGRLARIALGETVAVTAAGALAAVGLLTVGRALITAWRPQFPVVVTPGALAQVAVAAAAMAVIAAALPARRLSRVEAASAFRSES